MTSGRNALHIIDARIVETRRALSDDAAAAAVEAKERATLEAREMKLYRSLAELRIDAVEKGGEAFGAGVASLAEAEAAAARKLDAHEAFLAQVAQLLADATGALEAAERDRRNLEAEHADAVAAHDAAAEATRERLSAEPAYLAKADALEAAAAMSERARIKRDGARAARAEKGAPYEADPLFMYLFDRQYATPAYRAAAPVAALDGWVAGLIDYRNHRLNYARLLELPDRLADHVETLEDAAAEAEAALEALERAALAADGVDELRDRAGDLARAIEDADRRIAEAEGAHRDAAAAYAGAAAGDIGPFAEALEIVAGAIRALPMPDLRRLASATDTLEDDRLVDALITLKREKLEFEDARANAQKFAAQRSAQLDALEDVRRRFKAARYDSPYSEFRGERLVEALIADFLAGRFGHDDLWRRLQGGHRTRRRDWESDFGGDEWRDVFGLPRDSRRAGPWTTGGSWDGSSGGEWPGSDWPGSDWRDGGRARRPRIRRAPRPRGGRFDGGFGGGGFGGGGFGSGGGFGGGSGGFKTGGGF